MKTTRSHLAALCLVISSAVACTTTVLPGTGTDQSNLDGPGGGQCQSAGDCSAHQTCLDGHCVGTCDPQDFKCVTGCTDDVDCGPGHTCDDGVCSTNDSHCAEYCTVIEDMYGHHGLGNTLSASECKYDCDHLVPTGEKECVLQAADWHQVEACGRDGFQDAAMHDRWHSESDPLDNCLACQEWAGSGACMVAALNYENDADALNLITCEVECNYTAACISGCEAQWPNGSGGVAGLQVFWDCSVCTLCQGACEGTDLKSTVCPSG